MAAQEGSQGNANYKTWILRVSIHCEGCKRKVEKKLQKVPGVCSIDIDLKQQKVTVTGNVEGKTLLEKLHKSVKHAEILPQQPDLNEKKSSKGKNKEKQKDPEITAVPTSETKDASKAKVVSLQEPTAKVQDASGEASTKKEKPAIGSVKPKGIVIGTASVSGESVAKGGEVGETVNQSKSEGKKPVTETADKQQISVAAKNKGGDSDKAGASGEKSDGGPGGDTSGNTGKKKKKKGQNSNNTEGTPSSVAPAGTEFHHHNVGPQPVSSLANEGHPGYQYYPQNGQHYFDPRPEHVVSYNTARPISNHTTSYYSQAPPTSYAYTYSGPVMEPPPPSDLDSYPRQPLDSFEIFSDENPNGCSVM